MHGCTYQKNGLRNERILNLKPQSAKAVSYTDVYKRQVKSTSMGAGGEDVQLSPAARKSFPYTVECKNMAKIAVYNYYEQAKQHGKGEPLVIIKQNHSKPLVIVDAEFFFKELV